MSQAPATTRRPGVPDPRSPAPPSVQVANHVRAVVARVQGGYLPASGRPTSASVQALAALRRAQGAAGATDPRTWALVLDGLPVSLSGPQRSDIATPTAAEQAVLTALITYAVHQQSQRTPMHVSKVGVGQASQALARRRASATGTAELDNNAVDRMHRVAMAQTHELRAQALRALVTMMRSAQPAIGLDYGWLATDLYWLQHPQGAHRVHLAWARGLRSHRSTPRGEHDSTPSDNESGDNT